MIVVDASVLVEALLVGGPATDRLVGEELHAPHLLDAEVLSAVRGRLLGGHVEAVLATAAVGALGRFAVQRYPHPPLLGRAWELRSNVTAYGGLYLALAEALGAPLVTADAALATCPGLRTSVEVLPV